MTASSARCQAAVFDMDGLLIDSEPLWRIAEMEVFAELGVTLSEADCLRTMGLRLPEAVAYWRRERPWAECDDALVAQRISDRVTALVRERGTALPGVTHALEVTAADGLRLALASSSAPSLISTVLDTLGIGAHFASTHSAMDELHGKPDPAVYRRAAAALGVAPSACVAFEDSPAGVRAAHAAGMHVVAVPAVELAGDLAYELTDHVVESLAEVGPHLWR